MKLYPPGQITPYGAKLLLDRIDPLITYTSEDEGIQWYINGGLAPQCGVQAGAALVDGIRGLHPPFNHVDLKGARQDGTTWQHTVYDPAEYDMSIEFTVPPNHSQPELAAAEIRRVVRDWISSWDPRKPGTLTWTTPDMGRWYCRPRLYRAPPEQQFRAQARRLRQKYTWTIRNDDAFWRGVDSVSDFSFRYVQAHDGFDRDDIGTLGPQWSQVYSGAGAGVCETDTPNGTNEIQTVNISGNPSGGSFRLIYDVQQTVNIAQNATMAAVTSALEGLSNIGVGNVNVTGIPGNLYFVKFQGALSNRNISLMSATNTFIGGSTPNVTVNTFIKGSTGKGRARWIQSGTVERTVVNRFLGMNEIQTVTITGSSTGGDWVLTFNGQTTIPIAYNAAPTTVKLALEALSNIGVGDVMVDGDPGGPYTVTFTGTLGLANQSTMTSASVNEVQTVTITGSPTSGFFKLTYDGSPTLDIARNATASAVQLALEALPNIGVGDVLVTGGPGPATPYIVTFKGALGGKSINQMTASHTFGGGSLPNIGVVTTTQGVGLTGGNAPTVTVATMVTGTGPDTGTDNQVITLKIGTPHEWPFVNQFFDIWGRLDSAGTTGIRVRVGVHTVILSRFNAGVETVMLTKFLLNSPSGREEYKLICGTSTDARNFKLYRKKQQIFNFKEVGTGSALGGSNRGSGFGMKAGTGNNSQHVPCSIDEFSVGDNATITQDGHVTLTNFGDQDGNPRYLVYGPGIFKIGNGPNSTEMIEFGPLVDGQIALLTTIPRLRGVVDLSPDLPEQELTIFQNFIDRLVSYANNNNLPPLLEWFESLFGIRPPQGQLYSLLNGRFTNPIPPKPTSGPPSEVNIPVTIVDGDADSRIVAALTPLRRWPE